VEEDLTQPLISAEEPLSETRLRHHRREPAVVAQLETLTRMPARRVKDMLDTLEPETLVVAYRACLRRSLPNFAEHIRSAMSRRIAPFLNSRLRRFPGRDSEEWEDVVAELAVRLYQEWGDTSAKTEFWEVRFWKCLGLRLMDAMRAVRGKRVEVTESAEPDELVQDDSDAPLDRELRRIAAVAAMDHLPPDLVEVITYKYWWRLTDAQIARRLHCSERTVRVRIRKALALLRQHIGGDP